MCRMVQVGRILCKEATSPRGLYKVLFRTCDKLPKDAAKFYKQAVRKEYDQHRDEEDKERIQQIMERAQRDASWILNKYTNK